MQVHIIAVGRIKEKFLQLGISDYEKRLRPYVKLQIMEICEEKRPATTSSAIESAAKAKEGETVIFSFIIYKSKSHRDKVNAKVMQDPLMMDPAWKDKPMPFDMKKMAYGGFSVLIEGKKES